MSYKQYNNIIIGDVSKDTLLRGLEIGYNAAKVTLGHNGNNVTIMPYHHSHYEGKNFIQNTKDGVTVINALYSNNQEEALALDMLKQVCNKTLEEVGDGTTTTAILAYNLFRYGLEVMNVNNVNGHFIKKQIHTCVEQVLEKIDLCSRKIDKEKDLYDIGLISSNNDEEISKLLSSLLWKYKENANINIKWSVDGKSSVEHSEGMLLNKGYYNAKLLSNEYDKEKIMSSCLVLMTDENIHSSASIFPFISYASQKQVPLLIIGKSFNGDLLNFVMANNKTGASDIMLVNCPDFMTYERLCDLQTYIGGTVISKYNNTSFNKVLKDLKNVVHNTDKYSTYLGKCDTVTVTIAKTLFQLNDESKEIRKPFIDERINEIEKTIEMELSQDTNNQKYVVQKLEERKANLNEAIITIYIGGNSDLEIKERVDRVDDCVNSLKCALKGGYVIGGGMCLANIYKEMYNKNLNYGEEAVLKAIIEPCKQIIFNSNGNMDYTENVVWELLNKEGNNIVYNTNNNDYIDGYEYGIIDSTLVIKSALSNACSIASTLLLTQGIIVNQFVGND